MVITVRSGAKATIDPALFNLLQQYRESSTDLRAHVGPEPTGYAPPSPATDVIVQQLEAAGITKEDIQNINRDDHSGRARRTTNAVNDFGTATGWRNDSEGSTDHGNHTPFFGDDERRRPERSPSL